MAKKILILNGSPRRNGNTSALTAAFRRGAEAAGNTVTEFHLGSMNIRGCLGCWHGGKEGDCPCVQADDMAQIYPVYREADVVVLASPLFYWFISGQLKTAFDRLFAVAECDPNYRNPVKESVLIMAAEGAGFEESDLPLPSLGRQGWGRGPSPDFEIQRHRNPPGVWEDEEKVPKEAGPCLPPWL